MTVRDIARPKAELATARPNARVRDLAETMADRKVGSVLVIEDDAIRGIVTDRDIALKVVGAGKDAKQMTAMDVMTRDPFTVDVDTGVYDLFKAMREHGVRRAPVVEDDRLVGIVTMDDLLVLLEGEMHELSELVRAASPPYTPA